MKRPMIWFSAAFAAGVALALRSFSAVDIGADIARRMFPVRMEMVCFPSGLRVVCRRLVWTLLYTGISCSDSSALRCT